jgi:hypothetical protein
LQAKKAKIVAGSRAQEFLKIKNPLNTVVLVYHKIFRLSNNLKIIMKLAESDKTFNLLSGLTGEEAILDTTGFKLDPAQSGVLAEESWKDNFGA